MINRKKTEELSVEDIRKLFVRCKKDQESINKLFYYLTDGKDIEGFGKKILRKAAEWATERGLLIGTFGNACGRILSNMPENPPISEIDENIFMIDYSDTKDLLYKINVKKEEGDLYKDLGKEEISSYIINCEKDSLTDLITILTPKESFETEEEFKITMNALVETAKKAKEKTKIRSNKRHKISKEEYEISGYIAETIMDHINFIKKDENGVSLKTKLNKLDFSELKI